MSNKETLINLEFIVSNMNDLTKLQEALNSASKEQSLAASKAVFKGDTGILGKSSMWGKYQNYIGKKIVNVPEYIGVGSTNNDKTSLIGTFLEELKRPLQKKEKVSTDKGDTSYLEVLRQKGYVNCDDRAVIAGKNNKKTAIVKWLKGLYVEKVPTGADYKSICCSEARDILEEHDIDYRTADIWSRPIQELHEDLKFRLLVRETDISFSVLIKLPMNLNKFDFNSKAAQEQIQLLLGIFSSRESGNSYSSTLSGAITIKSIGYMFNLPECRYDAVVIELSKDLLKFKNSNFMLIDYLSASMGESNSFDGFRNDLCLGNKIVIGVKPGQLKSVYVNSTMGSEQQLNGCLMNGGAGSGKSALMDSLIVQALALNNGDYGKARSGAKLNRQGNGAVVLLDAKAGEWVKPWKRVIDSMGYCLLGFDGSIVPQGLVKYVDKKGNIADVPVAIPEFVLGFCLLSRLAKVIQQRCSQMGVKEVLKFNGVVSDNETMPRTVILVDEVNTMQNMAGGKEFGKFYSKIFMAKETRSASFHWVLAGQNLTKQVVPGINLPNYLYRIAGKMDKEGYEYHNIKLDKSVTDYESRTEAGAIMSQGMFYAGFAGDTELVKSMFLPDEESTRLQALQMLGGFKGLVEIIETIKWGLANTPDTFADALLQDKYPRNNSTIAALYIVGAINEKEYEYYSNYIMGTFQGEQQDGYYDEYNDVTEHNEEVYGFDLGDGANSEPVSTQDGGRKGTIKKNLNKKPRKAEKPRGFGDIDFGDFEVSDYEEPAQRVTKATRKRQWNEGIDFSGFEVQPSNESCIRPDGTVNEEVVGREYIEYIDKGEKFNGNGVTDKIKGVFEKSPIALKRYADRMLGNMLDTGANGVGGRTLVKKIAIYQDRVVVEGIEVMGLPDSIEMKNIINVKYISKKFKNLIYLIVDTPVMAAIYGELGDNAIAEVFKLNKKLQSLEVIKSNGKNISISRNFALAGKIDKESRARDYLNKACNSSESKKWELSDLTSKIYGFNRVEESFRRASDNIWHSGKGIHPMRALGWTAVGLGTLAVTGMFSGVVRSGFGVVNLIRKGLAS